MNELALFAGAGGGILGGRLLGWRTVCAVEWNSYAASVLVARQNDGCLDPFPIWDDVQTFDGRPWRGCVDIVSGGFPCQDISSARTNNDKNGQRLGLDGSQSGLWSEMARIINEVGPAFAFIENSANLRTMGLDQVLFDLDRMGYDARWGCFESRWVGADHVRKRMFILASDANQTQLKRGCLSGGIHKTNPDACRSNRREDQSRVERGADGMANQMDRLAAIGNGQDADVVRLAWETLTEGLWETKR